MEMADIRNLLPYVFTLSHCKSSSTYNTWRYCFDVFAVCLHHRYRVGSNSILFFSIKKVLMVLILILTISGWCIVLKATALVYDTSKLCLESWKYCQTPRYNSNDQKMFLKYKRYCRPLKILIGIHSYSWKGKLMLFLFSVSKGTGETLLTFG